MSLRAGLAGLADNPILERERLTRARSWGMPIGMSIFVCAVGAVAILQFSLAISNAPDGSPTAANMARAAFIATSLQLIVVFLSVPPVAASAIASERDRGTLDQLLLGRRSPRHILWSELLGALSYRLLLVVVAAPVLLAAYLYAGLGVGQFLLAELLIFGSAVALGAVAILLSTLMTRSLGATLSTYGLVLALRFGVAMIGSYISADGPLSSAPGAPPAVHPLVFGSPFYALEGLLTGPNPAGAHLGHLVGLLVGKSGNPDAWGPAVQPWQASVVGMALITLACMALATRVVGGQSPRSRRRRGALRRLGSTEINLPSRSRRGQAEGPGDPGLSRRLATAVGAVGLATVAVGAFGGSAGGQDPAPEEARGLTVTASPRWGRSTPGTWTPYAVTMANDGATDFEGALVLVPETTEPPPPPPGSTAKKAEVATTFPVLGLGANELTVRTGGALAPPASYPTHRSPVNLAAGASASLTVLVVEAPYGYRAELRDVSGATVAATPPTGGVQADQTDTVALLGGSPEVAATLRGLNGFLGPDAGALTVLGSARDLPDSALMLSGLQTLVIHGFDASTLGSDQIRALDDYVALGGSLVLTGGSEAAGRLRALPEALVPLAPTSTATVPMTPLTDLVDRPTKAMATVVTGPLRRGRAMLSTAEGQPLVVQADRGAGRVVQLTYDPQADALAADPALVDLAWQQAVPRALARFGPGASAPATVPAQLWAPALNQEGWPPWPRPALLVLAAYALLAGPAAYGILRARRAKVSLWAIAPAVALSMAVFTGAAGEVRGVGRQAVVRISTVGAGDLVLTSTYLGVQAVTSGGHTVSPGRSVAASTVFAPPSLMSIAAVPGGTAIGAGQGVVASRGDRATVSLRTKPGEVRSIQLVSLERRPSLESHLRMTGAGPPGRGEIRLRGTVTNRSAQPLRRLRAQLPEGARARLVEVIAPGATQAVDVPVEWPEAVLPGSLPRADATELLLFAAAARAFTHGGQVSVAGVEQAEAGVLAVVTEAVPLEGAEQVVALSGGAALVAMAPLPVAGQMVVQDLDGLAGLKAASISSSTYHDPPEVYDWNTRTWRLLPPGDRSVGVSDSSPVTPTEVRADGLVRVRLPMVALGPCCALTNPK